jgi:hypothetical protein
MNLNLSLKLHRKVRFYSFLSETNILGTVPRYSRFISPELAPFTSLQRNPLRTKVIKGEE